MKGTILFYKKIGEAISMSSVFNAINNAQLNYNWLITDMFVPTTKKPNLFNGEYVWLSGEELTDIVNEDNHQWIFAVLSGFPKDVTKEEVLQYKLPFADCNEEKWENPLVIMNPLAVVEIIPFDASEIYIFSKDDKIVDDFRAAVPEADDFSVFYSTNKIKTFVNRETNYIYHMLSVAGCGYDNEYGAKYRSLHSQDDLMILKSNESLITVAGGEHCGELYQWLISVPASLQALAMTYYEALIHLFKTGDIDENTARYGSLYSVFIPANDMNLNDFYEYYKKFDSIVSICEIMLRNYPIYCANVWKENEKELLTYANEVEKIFNENGFSDKLEEITREKLQKNFVATFCNSIDGGAEAIDISETQDVFGVGRNYEWAVKFISHEFIIYLLKQALVNTTAFQDLKYWLYTESLAEFYLSLTGNGGGFDKGQNVIEFYNEIYQKNNTITSAELYNRAIDKFIYKDIFNEVKTYLLIHGGEDDDRGFTFRKRSEHIQRVFTWVERLIEDCTENIDRDSLLIAALFHDIGYSKSLTNHADQSALIFREYAENHGYSKNQTDFIEYLVRNHSDKDILFAPEIPLELVFLLEADMLDETGALGIIWDAMMSGGKAAQNYMEAYNLLLSHSCSSEIINENPMRSAKAKAIWENKQNLVKEFLKQLEYDLISNEGENYGIG